MFCRRRKAYQSNHCHLSTRKKRNWCSKLIRIDRRPDMSYISVIIDDRFYKGKLGRNKMAYIHDLYRCAHVCKKQRGYLSFLISQTEIKKIAFFRDISHFLAEQIVNLLWRNSVRVDTIKHERQIDIQALVLNDPLVLKRMG